MGAIVMSWSKALLFAAIGIAVAGCATSRSEIKVASPPAAKAVAAATRGSVFIRAVTDERVFEEAPRDPSTPSLGSGGAASASADVKARAIGRKRNTYGKGLGDVLLENGQTVIGLVRENVAAAFQQAGYAVVEQADAAATPVDVHVKQCWAWFKPGFWAITLNANIGTDVDLGGQVVTVSTHSEQSGQFATDSSWMEIVSKAFDDYRAQLVAKLTAQ
jgi:hypothetical protein